MLAQEIKESLKRLTPSELLELKREIDGLCPSISSGEPEMDRSAKIARAKCEIFTEYDSLLGELAK